MGYRCYRLGRHGSTKILNAIIEWFNKLPGRMMDIGKNILKGVWNGILSMGDWLKQKIDDFFGGIGDGIADAVGIGQGTSVDITPVQKFATGGFPTRGNCLSPMSPVLK